MACWRPTWVYDSVTSFPNGGGDHSEMAADTDGDGGQEIITGPLTIDSGGTLKVQLGNGHGDAMDVGELVPGKGHLCASFGSRSHLGAWMLTDGATCQELLRRLPFSARTPAAGGAGICRRGHENGAVVFRCKYEQPFCVPMAPPAPLVLGTTSSSTGTPMNGVSSKTPTKSPKASGTTAADLQPVLGAQTLTKSTPGADRRPAGRLARGNHLARNEQTPPYACTQRQM